MTGRKNEWQQDIESSELLEIVSIHKRYDFQADGKTLPHFRLSYT